TFGENLISDKIDEIAPYEVGAECHCPVERAGENDRVVRAIDRYQVIDRDIGNLGDLGELDKGGPQPALADTVLRGHDAGLDPVMLAKPRQVPRRQQAAQPELGKASDI